VARQIELKVAGVSPATAFFSENEKEYTVSIQVANGFNLRNTCVKYKTGKNTWKQVNFKSSIVRQPKNLYCVYILEFMRWGNLFYLTFNLGLPPVTNLKFDIVKGNSEKN
jgi:hypothetical protein